MPLSNPENIIQQVKMLVESDKRSEIRLNANGGNSILVICEPMSEAEYITKIEELLPSDGYHIIDLNQCLNDFITENKDEIVELYNLLQTTTHEIFKAPAGEESSDLFKEIISRISQSLQQNKIPVLINTGSLYGTGIHNIHIMENEVVMRAAFPLVILYPATKETDQIMFLGKQPASKYRCMIIQ